jgi:hypothetical protein
MTGRIKMKLLVTGKSKSGCSKGVNNLPVEYAHNVNAWMTASVFEDYLRNCDTQIRKRETKIMPVLAHPKLNLENIELTFLPPNTTSHIQPLDQGII